MIDLLIGIVFTVTVIGMLPVSLLALSMMLQEDDEDG